MTPRFSVSAFVTIVTVTTACVQASNSKPISDPVQTAIQLYDTYRPSDVTFTSDGTPANCPARFASYGTDSPSNDVIEYYRGDGLSETHGVEKAFGEYAVWAGVDERADELLRVEVWKGDTYGHRDWKTVFTIATMHCDLKAAAAYSVSPRRVSFGDLPHATLTNTGDIDITYGLAYSIERFSGGRWRTVPFGTDHGIPCVFPDIGIVLSPGGSDKHRVSLCDSSRRLEPGRYRIAKDVSFEDFNEKTLRASFVVLARPQ